MGYLEQKCPKCGAKYNESCNAWAYGSPIRKCPKCNHEFLDKRWTEVAIDGFRKGKKNARTYLLAACIFLALTIVCTLWLKSKMDNGEAFTVKAVGCISVGIAGTIMSLVLFLRTVTGYEDKQNEKYMAESKRRLQNKEYVEKLMAYGYHIPDEIAGNR